MENFFGNASFGHVVYTFIEKGIQTVGQNEVYR